jgi:hypothetical protein
MMVFRCFPSAVPRVPSGGTPHSREDGVTVPVVASQPQPPFELAARRVRREHHGAWPESGQPAAAPGTAAHARGPVGYQLWDEDRLSAGEYQYPAYLGAVVTPAVVTPAVVIPTVATGYRPIAAASAVPVAPVDAQMSDPLGGTGTQEFSPWAPLPWPWRPPAVPPVGLDVLARVVAGLERLGRERW